MTKSIKDYWKSFFIEVMQGLVVYVRVVEHRLGRDTPDVEARPAQSTPLLYARCLQRAPSTVNKGNRYPGVREKLTRSPSWAALIAAT